MKALSLLQRSSVLFGQEPESMVGPTLRPFDRGGRWMAVQLARLEPERPAGVLAQAFAIYGWIKYGISIAAALLTAWLLYNLYPALALGGVAAFYLVEVLFVFLFPLLIDGVRRPLARSIRCTFQAGYFRVLVNVILIAAYMLSGLFTQSPLCRWHIGCGAILIWYQDEIRDRV
jgi:hypothetical protein